MDNRINVLDIEIDNCMAKESMKESIEYLESEPVNVVEFVTINGLMQMDDMPELKEKVREFDLVLAGDKTILEAADVTDHKYLQETERRVFLKMFMRYLHKNHKRVYLLVESEEEGKQVYNFLQHSYGGLQIIGMAKVSAQDRADDMLVNAINGGEVDCVLSTLSSPLQEDFIVKNRCLLDIRVWMGIGKDAFATESPRFGQGRVAQFLLRHIFKREMEKRKRIES
ncbi:MAG: WecB/TagA/CpsF family glycosyltransferase [Roseburia sp.]